MPSRFFDRCVLIVTAKNDRLYLNSPRDRKLWVEGIRGRHEKLISRQRRTYCNGRERRRARGGYACEGAPGYHAAIQLVRILCRREFRRSVDQRQPEYSKQQFLRRPHRVHWWR